MRRLSPLALVSLVAAGCGQDAATTSTTTSTTESPFATGFTDRTATVFLDGRTLHFTLDSCGLDSRAFHLAGRDGSGATLEAVVVVEDDGRTGVPEATWITVSDLDGLDLSAFGEEAWAEQGPGGEAAGRIGASRIDSISIAAGGDLAVVDEDGRPTGEERPGFLLDAFCDEED